MYHFTAAVDLIVLESCSCCLHCSFSVPSDVLDAAGSSIEFVVPKAGEGNIPITDKYSLNAVLTPTPRWPDAMCIIDPASKVVFTSKFFSAHVAPGLLNSKVSG